MTVSVKVFILLVIPCALITATHPRECGEKNLIGHHETSNNTTATVVITDLDIEEDEAPCPAHEDCCKNNALTISNEKLCGPEQYPPRIVATGATTTQIFFRTSKNPRRRKGFRLVYSVRSKTLCEGYDLSCLDERDCYNRSDICDSRYKCADHSDEINCAKCDGNHASCNDRSTFCFDPSTQRCNGIYDCPEGEDERNCVVKCPNRLQCENGRGCYTKSQICDHNVDCLDYSDESDCTRKLCGKPQENFLCKNRKCINIELVGNDVDDCGDNSDEDLKKKVNMVALIILSTLSLFVFFVMLIYRWYVTRRNVHRFVQDLPVFPLPPFRGPGETDHGTTSNLFSQSDFVHGGQIYEAFVRTRRRLPPARTGRRSSTPVQGGLCCFRNCNPSCTAAALASLGIISDSCASELCQDYEKCDFCECARDGKGFSNSTASCSNSANGMDHPQTEVIELYLIPNNVRLVGSKESYVKNE